MPSLSPCVDLSLPHLLLSCPPHAPLLWHGDASPFLPPKAGMRTAVLKLVRSWQYSSWGMGEAVETGLWRQFSKHFTTKDMKQACKESHKGGRACQPQQCLGLALMRVVVFIRDWQTVVSMAWLEELAFRLKITALMAYSISFIWTLPPRHPVGCLRIPGIWAGGEREVCTIQCFKQPVLISYFSYLCLYDLIMYAFMHILNMGLLTWKESHFYLSFLLLPLLC